MGIYQITQNSRRNEEMKLKHNFEYTEQEFVTLVGMFGSIAQSGFGILKQWSDHSLEQNKRRFERMEARADREERKQNDRQVDELKSEIEQLKWNLRRVERKADTTDENRSWNLDGFPFDTRSPRYDQEDSE